MKNISKILFPTDFSENAQNAFQHALVFADQMNASIKVLHAVYPESAPLDVPVVAVQPTLLKVDTAKEIQKQFIDFCTTKAKENYDFKNEIDVTTEVEVGTLTNTVIENVHKENIDLIIMGIRAKHNIFEKIFGSASSSIISNAPCHVMVLPEGMTVGTIESIGYATDLLKSDPQYILEVVQLLKPFNPSVKCIHIQTSKKEKKQLDFEELVQFFKDERPGLHISFYQLEGLDPVHRLNKFIETWDIDLLVMFAPQRGMWEHLIYVSNTQKMAFKSQVPLLILKESS
jgi:nucleotide-binding universal stress UspA family protein